MFFESELAPDENELLNKIIAAVGIDEKELNKHFDLPLESINELIKESKGICILWGIDYAGTEKYKLMQIERSQIIVSDKLELIKTDQVVKAKLWNCLKEAFNK